MKKIMVLVMVICAAVFFSQEAFAQVDGEGTLSFDFGTNPPDNTSYIISDGYYGMLGELSPTQDNIPGFLGYQQDGSYAGSASHLGNSTSATWRGIGPSSYSFLAQAPALGGMSRAEVDLYASMSWNGTFPGFTYHYDYHGTSDSPEDMIGFLTQMEISRDGTLYYSDYASWAPEFQTKFHPFHSPVPGVIDAEGDVTFDPINEVGYWSIRYDFMGSGYDYAPTSIVTPEPVSGALFLLGGGFMALKRYRRKK